MKNKNGFTLVELLAVIAILAILVIVAMPNVLSMFNESKQNTFITEVQKIMDTAKGEFVGDAFNKGGQAIYYSSTDNNILNTSKLDMDVEGKEYFIEMDRHGEFKRVVIFDDNYCYDIYDSGGSGNVGGTKSIKITDIKKSSVNIKDLWESGNDKVEITNNGNNYFVKGCEGVKSVTGDIENNPVTPQVEFITTVIDNNVTIDGIDESYYDYSKVINIPLTIDGESVVEISDTAFNGVDGNNEKIEVMVIPQIPAGRTLKMYYATFNFSNLKYIEYGGTKNDFKSKVTVAGAGIGATASPLFTWAFANATAYIKCTDGNLIHGGSGFVDYDV